MSLHLLKEVERLKKMILSLGARVEENLRIATQAIAERDPAPARRVIDTDPDIDRTEVEIEEECLKTLALHQPVAGDLRYIVAVLKLNNDLERIGDLAEGIAKCAIQLASLPEFETPFDMTGQALMARSMLKRSLDALVHMDVVLAEEVCRDDAEVDAIYRGAYGRVEAAIQDSPGRCRPAMLLMSVSRNLERVADHATNIAEDVIYMVRGRIVRHNARGAGEPKA